MSLKRDWIVCSAQYQRGCTTLSGVNLADLSKPEHFRWHFVGPPLDPRVLNERYDFTSTVFAASTEKLFRELPLERRYNATLMNARDDERAPCVTCGKLDLLSNRGDCANCQSEYESSAE